MGQRVFRLAHSFFDNFVDFVFPAMCLVCQTRLDPSIKFVCDSCWSGFTPLAQPLLSAEQLSILQNSEKYFSQSFALYDYTPAIQDLIHFMKYKAMPGIASRFGTELGNVLAGNRFLHDGDVILPVPLHALRQRERGYNQAVFIAREIGKVYAKTCD